MSVVSATMLPCLLVFPVTSACFALVEVLVVGLWRMRLHAEAVCCVRVGCCVMAWEREEGLTPVMQEYSCAVTSAGGVKCWGRNRYYQVMLHTLLSVTSCNSAFAVAGEEPVVADEVFICRLETAQQLTV
jgi:hypothetical protein